jgi:hypothetical protein
MTGIAGVERHLESRVRLGADDATLAATSAMVNDSMPSVAAN